MSSTHSLDELSSSKQPEKVRHVNGIRLKHHGMRASEPLLFSAVVTCIRFNSYLAQPKPTSDHVPIETRQVVLTCAQLEMMYDGFQVQRRRVILIHLNASHYEMR